MVTTARTTAALGAAITLTCISTGALAHHPGGPGNVGGAGPINTISAATLAEGTAVVGIVFDYIGVDPLSDEALIKATEHAHEGGSHAHVHSLDSIMSRSLNAAYGVTDNLTVAMRLPFIDRGNIRTGHAHEHEGETEVEAHALGDASGIGDLSAMAQWRFLNNRPAGFQASLLFGFKAPTGATGETAGDGEPFEAEFQPGSGSWDGLVGLALAQRVHAWSFNASALYTVVTKGVQSTDLGDRVNYGASVSYRVIGGQHGQGKGEPIGRSHDRHFHDFDVNGRHSQGPALDLILELNGEWHDKQVIGGETDPNSGGHVLYLAPGVRLSMDKWSGFVSAGIPIVNDFNGVQAEPDWRLVTGVTLGF